MAGLMISTVSSVCLLEQSTTGVGSTQSSKPRLRGGVFRHSPTLGGGGTSPAAVEPVGEAADRVGPAAAAELASLVHPVQATHTPMVTSRAAARRSLVMSIPVHAHSKCESRKAGA